MTRVTVDDVAAAGHCTGLKLRAKYNSLGLSTPLRTFIREGIPIEDLAHIDDADVKSVLDAAKRRENG